MSPKINGGKYSRYSSGLEELEKSLRKGEWRYWTIKMGCSGLKGIVIQKNCRLALGE